MTRHREQDQSQQRGTLTVTEQVCYQHPLHDPSHATSRYSQALYNDDQPYQRTIRVGSVWQELDAGWLAGTRPSLLTLVNKGPADLEVWFGHAGQSPSEETEALFVPAHNQSLRLPNPRCRVWVRATPTADPTDPEQTGCTIAYLFLPGEGKGRRGFTVAPTRHHVTENGPPTGPLGNVVQPPGQ